MFKHTQGPWTFYQKPSKPDNDGIIEIGKIGAKNIDIITNMPDVFNEFKDEAIANARLMATAPEMLSALVRFNSTLPEKISGEMCVTIEMLEAIAMIRSVIIKATEKV